MATPKNALPRLGSAGASKARLKTQEVEIPDREVSVVLRAPSVGMVLEIQSRLNSNGNGNKPKKGETKDETREAYESTLSLVSKMLVEPELTEDELKAEVDGWVFADWQVLQEAAMDMAGLRQEAEATAAEEFQEPSDA